MVDGDLAGAVDLGPVFVAGCFLAVSEVLVRHLLLVGVPSVGEDGVWR